MPELRVRKASGSVRCAAGTVSRGWPYWQKQRGSSDSTQNLASMPRLGSVTGPNSSCVQPYA
jgi:hypothetical protein